MRRKNIIKHHITIVLCFVSITMNSGCQGGAEDEIFVAETDEIIVTETVREEENIIVEIKGQVKNPGVYSILSGSRLNDLMILSGGALHDANLRNVNLAMKISDGDSFYIPSTEESDQHIVVGETGSGDSKPKIDLNRATREELMSVTGIGPSTADNILAYREEKGRFSSVDELTGVNRIGDKTLEKIRDYFIVR